MAQHLFFNPRRRENALWASAVETILRRRHPGMPLRELRNLPMMQGVYLHLQAWEDGRALPTPETPEALARLGEVERQAFLSQTFLGLATLDLTATGGGADFYNNQFIPAVLSVDRRFDVRQFSTSDYAGFFSCLVVWRFYYANGLTDLERELLNGLLEAAVQILGLTPTQVTNIQELIKEVDDLLPVLTGSPYRTAPANYGALEFPDDARVILLGDWGTSLPDAEALLAAIWGQTYEADPTRPIVFVHLGDIYYSGLPVECQQNFHDVFDRVRQNLSGRYGSDFAAAAQNKIYLIPGNHEYYSKAFGYFALVDQINNELATGQQCSFFCLRNASKTWQFLGMDTGQDDHNAFEPIAEKIRDVLLPAVEAAIYALVPFPFSLWVDHWLTTIVQDYTGPFAPQLQASELAWHQARLAEATAQTPTMQTILLSHHQLFSSVQEIDHRTPQFLNVKLRQGFELAFVKQVAAWYWGHEHSYAIYQGGLFGLSKGRLLGSSSYEASREADHPYKIAYPKIPFDSGMTIPHPPDGFYPHACAVFDFGPVAAHGNVAVSYWGYPSWGQNDPEPSPPPPLFALFRENLVALTTGAFQPVWFGSNTIAKDVNDSKGNYQSNPYQSTAGPALALSSDRQTVVMVWPDSSDNTLHWATAAISTPDDGQQPTLSWTPPRRISATNGSTALATDATPALVACGKVFVLVYKKPGAQGLKLATLVPGDSWYDWGAVTDPNGHAPQTNSGPGLTAAFEGAYLAYADANDSNDLKWMIYKPNPDDGPSAGSFGPPNRILDNANNSVPATGPLGMCANATTAFLLYRADGKDALRLATRTMVRNEGTASEPKIRPNPDLSWSLHGSIEVVGTNDLTTDEGGSIAADDDFLYLVYTQQSSGNLRQALLGLEPGANGAWRGDLNLQIQASTNQASTNQGSPKTPTSMARPGFVIGNQMALLVYPGLNEPHLREAWV